MSPPGAFWDGLAWLAHSSAAVPLLVWMHRRRLRPALRPLVAYAWLLLGSTVLEHNVEPQTTSYQLGIIILLNLAKIGLFAAVYYQVLHQPVARYGVVGLAAATLLGGLLWLLPPDTDHQFWVANYARLGQCAMLASFALAYLEQLLNATLPADLSRDPLFLLSVGQLLYSALTVTYFSLASGPAATDISEAGLGLVSVAGLIFNGFLSVAFLYGSTPRAASSS